MARHLDQNVGKTHCPWGHPYNELRLSGLAPEHGRESADRGAVDLLERLGERWYRLAARTMRGPLTGTMPVVAEMAERFGPARRTLNHMTATCCPAGPAGSGGKRPSAGPQRRMPARSIACSSAPVSSKS